MVETQIEARGVRNPRVLEAMRSVPRHLFVPDVHRGEAYEDRPVPIGSGQTISQPYVVAAMTEALDPSPDDHVLEVGTGSGYQAAVLSLLVARVHTIEILPELAERARRLLSERGYDNVVVVTGDGFAGLPAVAPFDGILVTAATGTVPPALLEQLRPGGRLVIPVGAEQQELKVFERTAEGFSVRTLFAVQFVPMTRGAREEEPPPAPEKRE
jgi:protein-L-isoaspartate(D-aspartate) O-methyltransferase